ncbi:hypothetical protein KFK09_005780 [Dendrobium nobile]|uniref:Uncharacterized protein n=1 Tax=Dendrobium nobile TaxID=94219 RepID=A0A8T3C218_DENNO|nr:hypothetical protein KFK09_005780 [Dendrobium nobile]
MEPTAASYNEGSKMGILAEIKIKNKEDMHSRIQRMYTLAYWTPNDIHTYSIY